MVDHVVVAALVKKRRDLATEIDAAHDKLRQMILDLEKIDATLLMFDPKYEIASIKPKAFRPPADWANRGEMTRIVLGILRQAAEPMTARDIAMQMLIQRALDKDDQRLLRLMCRRVGYALRRQRDNGVTQSTQGTGQYMLWKLVRQAQRSA